MENVIVKEGKKYRRDKNGKLRQLCVVEGCIKRIQSAEYGHFCRRHFTRLADTDEERKRMIEKKKKEVQKELVEKRNDHIDDIKKVIEIINGKEIYIYNGIKYRLRDNKHVVRLCMFNDCTQDAKFDQNNESKFCKLHKNGTSPDDPERKKEIELRHIKFKENGKLTNSNGEEIEKWVFNLMKIFNGINSMEIIGYVGHKLDIIYKVDGEDKFRGIQVKTLVKSYSNDRYDLDYHKSEYNSDTLIVGINKDKNRFVLFFVKDITFNKITFSFNTGKCKYKEFMYTSIGKFLVDLEEKLKHSCFYYKDDVNKDIKKEIESMERISKKCQDNGISFKRVNVKDSVVDCVINGFNIQCKTSGKKKNNISYNFGIRKNAGKINGKRTFQSYSDKDGIDFFIFEILDYPGNFYIIHIKEMIKHNRIKTSSHKGRTSMLLPRPDSEKPHWSKPYLNNFDQLKKNEFWDKILKGNNNYLDFL